MLNRVQQERIIHDYQMLLLLFCTSKKPLCFVYRKTNLMHNLFLVYFVNLYMFLANLGPSSGGTTLCIQQLVFIILFSWLSVVLVGLELRISCASWWFFFTRLYRDARSTKHKTFAFIGCCLNTLTLCVITYEAYCCKNKHTSPTTQSFWLLNFLCKKKIFKKTVKFPDLTATNILCYKPTFCSQHKPFLLSQWS